MIHQGSYAGLVLTVALAVLSATYLPRWFAVTIISASVAWFGLEWLPGLGFHWAQPGLATSTDWTIVGLGMVAVALTVLLLLQRIDGRAPSCGVGRTGSKPARGPAAPRARSRTERVRSSAARSIRPELVGEGLAVVYAGLVARARRRGV
jgi:hypothetical protein